MAFSPLFIIEYMPNLKFSSQIVEEPKLGDLTQLGGFAARIGTLSLNIKTVPCHGLLLHILYPFPWVLTPCEMNGT